MNLKRFLIGKFISLLLVLLSLVECKAQDIDYNFYWRLRNFRCMAYSDYWLKNIKVRLGQWNFVNGRYFNQFTIVYEPRKEQPEPDLLWNIARDFAVNVLDSTTTDCNAIYVSRWSSGLGNGILFYQTDLLDSAKRKNKEWGLDPQVKLKKIIPPDASNWLDKKAVSIRCHVVANYCSANRNTVWFSGAVGVKKDKKRVKKRMGKKLYHTLRTGSNSTLKWQLSWLDYNSEDMTFTGVLYLK